MKTKVPFAKVSPAYSWGLAHNCPARESAANPCRTSAHSCARGVRRHGCWAWKNEPKKSRQPLPSGKRLRKPPPQTKVTRYAQTDFRLSNLPCFLAFKRNATSHILSTFNEPKRLIIFSYVSFSSKWIFKLFNLL